MGAVLLACTLLLQLGQVTVTAAYDPTRYYKALRLPEEDSTYLQHGSTAHQLHRHQTVEALKQHPEWQRLQHWRQAYQAGQAEAGAAFAGRIPHDLVHHLAAPSSPQAAEEYDRQHEGHHMHASINDL